MEASCLVLHVTLSYLTDSIMTFTIQLITEVETWCFGQILDGQLKSRILCYRKQGNDLVAEQFVCMRILL
jgi:hypothetical protein